MQFLRIILLHVALFSHQARSIKVLDFRVPSFRPPYSAIISSERPECKGLKQFEVQADGRVMCWKADEDPYECYSAWPMLKQGKANWRPLEPGVVDFLNAFFDRQRRILCSTPVKEQRIFFIQRYNGLGNSIEGTMSFVMMGTLSDRLVVLNGWLGAFGDVFDSPLAEFTMENLQRLKLMDSWNPGACQGITSHDPEYGCFGPDGDDQYQWCGRVDDRFPRRLNVVTGCCNNALPFLMMNPHYAWGLKRAFGEYELSTPLYRVLWRPSHRNVISKIEPTPAGTVSVHLRHFGNYAMQDLVKAAGECAEQRVKESGAIQQVKVFAIDRALTNEFKGFMKSSLVNGPVVVSSDPPGGEFHDEENWQLALKDMWSMAMSDFLVLSPWSSFGQVAAAYGGISPWESDGDMSSIASTCYQAVSSEPCTMRMWGPEPGVCPKGNAAVEKLPPRLDRSCDRPVTKHVPLKLDLPKTTPPAPAPAKKEEEGLASRIWGSLSGFAKEAETEAVGLVRMAETKIGMKSNSVSTAAISLAKAKKSKNEAAAAADADTWLSDASVAALSEQTFQNISRKYSKENWPSYCPTQYTGLYPEWSKEVKRVAKSRAVDGKVIFTMADKKYADKLHCWQRSVQALTGMDNTVILATDTQTMQACMKQRLKGCVVVDDYFLPPIKYFGHIGFFKFYSMALISSARLSFVFSEMDILIMKNPWAYHEKQDNEQFAEGDARCYPKYWTKFDPTKSNAPTEKAVIQVTEHFNHPRVNIGYVYSRASTQSMQFFSQLTAYYVGKCADPDLGYVPPANPYVDDGHADQNIFDAFLRNSDHTNPRYSDVPWDKLPKLNWKLLDFNLFGIYGKSYPTESVTYHYAGQPELQASCWKDVCDGMERLRLNLSTAKEELNPPCVKIFHNETCIPRKPGAAPTIQAMLRDICLPNRLECKGQ
eukprot:TRINITY_DN40166_c0_g1_i1.p1 TRINITY_DN40166_c0_g1~~TRINITY_DN40166_c0_g1_i1.p1  ORF type:complete len:933 (-),score=176.13 TRINITY_DN40166_c0_g1_i1:157-2955(-)